MKDKIMTRCSTKSKVEAKLIQVLLRDDAR